jgi:DNA-binding beta-propeller fold protein YncE
MSLRWSVLPGLAASVLLLSPAASAQVIGVAVDRSVTSQGGRMTPVEHPEPDSAFFFDASANPPGLLGEVQAGASVGGPPASIAVSKDGKFAIVSDGDGGTRQAPANGHVALIDLSGQPRVVETVEAGVSPGGVAITPNGTLALVANRGSGTISVFSIDDMHLKLLDTLEVGRPNIQMGGIAISPDGKLALVTMSGANGVAILDIKGERVSRRPEMLVPGVRPYDVRISPDGKWAAVGNMGSANPDIDSVSIVDLSADPIRVVNTVAVGIEPEGLAFSPDSKFLAVAVQNGSQTVVGGPFYHKNSKLIVYGFDEGNLTKVSQADAGVWTQGAAFSPDGKQIYVESMTTGTLQVFDWDGMTVKDSGRSIPLHGGGAAMAVSY